MSTIFLFRHGQTEFNRDKIFTGWLQSNLTPLGIDQSNYLARLLQGKTVNLAYTPNLTRCQETLKIILKSHPECADTIIDDRILERNYGDLGGKYHQEIIKKFGQEQFDKWHRGWNDRPPAGESYADVEIRISQFISDLKAKYNGQNLGIAICGSSNSIRLFRKIMENTTEIEAVSWVIPYDQYFEYQI
jgi:2,3-bisphosphoglycerate-dependent phosphoglycerate mutase